MTTTAAAPIAEPKVRRRLRRRPPASIRNGRALLASVAGYGFMVLFAAILGMFIGIKGVPGVLPLIAAITIPVGLVCIAVSRLTKTRQLWSLVLVVLVWLPYGFSLPGFLQDVVGDPKVQSRVASLLGDPARNMSAIALG